MSFFNIRYILPILFSSLVYGQDVIYIGQFDQTPVRLTLSGLDSLMNDSSEIECSYLAIVEDSSSLLTYDHLDGRVRIIRYNESNFSIFLRYGFLIGGEWVELEMAKYNLRRKNKLLEFKLDESFSIPIKVRNSLISSYLIEYDKAMLDGHLTIGLHDSLSFKMFLGAISGNDECLRNFIILGESKYDEFITTTNCFCWKYYHKILLSMKVIPHANSDLKNK